MAERSPRVGFGERPAVLVVDFARGWTDPGSEFALPVEKALRATRALLDAARGCGRPVLFTTVAYDDAELDSIPMLRKTPRVKAMRTGSWRTEIDPRVAPGAGELVVTKKHASAFYGTSLASHLAAHAIDTVLIAGCITSGCVRASAVDAAQHGLRALVVEDAVADRSAEAHAAALSSIDSLYGDVVSLATAIKRLRDCGASNQPRSLEHTRQ